MKRQSLRAAALSHARRVGLATAPNTRFLDDSSFVTLLRFFEEKNRRCLKEIKA